MSNKGKSHLGGYDGPPKTVAEALDRTGKLDERRQKQIARQSAIINRLVTENQIMMGFIGEIAALDDDVVGYRSRSQEVLDNIQQLRDDNDKKGNKHD